jgi:hypothetical protein
MTANVALDSADRGALPGRSTTMACTFAWVAASASVEMGQLVKCCRAWYILVDDR